MANYSLDQIAYSYDISKKVYENKMTVNEGVADLELHNNMNRGSAHMIVFQIFPNMMTGNKFTRTLGVSFFEYFLSHILQDYGTKQLSLALTALKKHIKYISRHGDSKVKLKEILSKYLAISKNPKAEREPEKKKSDKKQQDEIVELIKTSGKTKEEVAKELNNLKDTDPQTIIINRKTYKRDNNIIAQIKFVRDFNCQICGTSIKKRDGSKYIEAAHILPKNKGGGESLDNIILLCPNHHKEFDYGILDIKLHSKKIVKFILNGARYEIVLTI